jgi:hypothetical protein
MLTFISDVSSVVAVNTTMLAHSMPSRGVHPINACPNAASGFGHRVAFGSRFPILLDERSPVLPGSLETNQDNRDIIDAPSVGLVPRGS